MELQPRLQHLALGQHEGRLAAAGIYEVLNHVVGSPQAPGGDGTRRRAPSIGPMSPT